MQYQQFCHPEKCQSRCIDEIKYKVYEMKCIIVVKECPRCGCECEHMATECPQCGYQGHRMLHRPGKMMHMGRMMGRINFDDDDD